MATVLTQPVVQRRTALRAYVPIGVLCFAIAVPADGSRSLPASPCHMLRRA